MGKLVFYDIKADGEKVQAMAAADNSPLDEAGFVTLHNRQAATAPALSTRLPCGTAPRLHQDVVFNRRHAALGSQPRNTWLCLIGP